MDPLGNYRGRHKANPRLNYSLLDVPVISGVRLLGPCFQYVFRPSGGIPNPNDPSGLSRIGDAAVFGVTTQILITRRCKLPLNQKK